MRGVRLGLRVLWGWAGFLGVFGVAVAVVLVWGAGVAGASVYREVGRYGCYVTNGCEPGEPGFATPVGFTVEANQAGPVEERNAVYVLEQSVTGEPSAVQYTLRKLQSPQTKSPGKVLGTMTGKPVEFANREEAHALIGLTLDEREHRIYSLVESNGGSRLPSAYELLAWSTVPNTNGELVAAAKPATAPDGTYQEEPALHAAIVAKFEPSSQLKIPEAIAVEAAGNGDVAIEAQNGSGAPVLERVATSGPQTGKTESPQNFWQAPSQDGEEVPDGLSAITANPGSFAIDMTEGGQATGAVARLLEVQNDAFGDTTEATPLIPVETEYESADNKDQAAALKARLTPNYSNGGLARRRILEPYAAGSQFVELANGDYAAGYGWAGERPEEPDFQSDLTGWGAQYTSWLQRFSEESEAGNMGVRIVTSQGGVVTTLGGGGETTPCHIGTARIALAAGGENTVFVLTSPAPEDEYAYGEVIEYSETGAEACPQPSGEIEANGTPTNNLPVRAGETVEFSAASIERAGEAPYKLEWNFTDEPGFKVGSEMGAADGYRWPDPAITHTFNTHGTYNVELRLTGDYGTTTLAPLTVTVLEKEAPVIPLECPSAYEQEPITCSAEGALGENSAFVSAYEWNFGDGTPTEPTLEPTAPPHTFTEPKTYNVTLTIAYVANGKLEHASKTIPVAVGETKAPTIPLKTPTTVTAGQSAEFKATGSEGKNGTPVSKYTWEYGDNTTQTTETPTTTHTYTTAATYTLKLTITYKLNTGTEETATETTQITVQPSNTGGGGGGGSTTPTTTPTTTTPQIEVKPSIASKPPAPLTRAQKLANALKACKKIKNKHKRATCETQAHKKYNPPTREKHKTKKK